MDKWLERFKMAKLEFYLDRFGDTKETRETFYQIIVDSVGKELSKFELERGYGITHLLSDVEYQELHELRQNALLEINKLK